MKIKIIAAMEMNFQSNRDVIEMLNKCEDLGIKYAEFLLFEKYMVHKEVVHCYIDETRAKKFYNAGKKRGIEVFFSCLYPNAIDICESLGVKYYKIKYVDRNNLILYRRLKKIEKLKEKIIFVSCQDPKDTIFRNMARYQGNVRFLYCVPKYPAEFRDYFKPNMYSKEMKGVIDNTMDFDLFEDIKMIMDWIEIHITKVGWQESFERLKEFLK